MDESAYKQTRSSWSERICPFEKTVLAKCVYCSRVDKHNLAEREVVLCQDAAHRARCISLYGLLRSNFTFALGVTHIDEPLPHAQEMRLQCGGLIGVQYVLDGSEEVSDVVHLLDSAQQRYGELEQLPYREIVAAAKAHYHYRR
ncbi:MAG: hypothetical protein PXX77_11065 [Gallionella sp.]|nr:hypothetical protein [Gallionella sp.]